MMDWWREAPSRHPRPNKGDHDEEGKRQGWAAARERDGRPVFAAVLQWGYKPVGWSGDPDERDGQGGRPERWEEDSRPLWPLREGLGHADARNGPDAGAGHARHGPTPDG